MTTTAPATQQPPPPPEPEIGTGKTIFVIAVVLGCFAVLYPKIFYHMMFDEKKADKHGKQLIEKVKKLVKSNTKSISRIFCFQIIYDQILMNLDVLQFTEVIHRCI